MDAIVFIWNVYYIARIQERPHNPSKNVSSIFSKTVKFELRNKRNFMMFMNRMTE